ncbi:MAG: hypothetical protein KBS67_05365 [Bacteroidales bacterium]|nr:hypothetical protein [Candidatus Cryptobacteroides equifaecalis]
MARKDAMNDIHSKILRKFHTLCGVCGLSQDEKSAIVESYGVSSSRDIGTHDLIDICEKLSVRAGQGAGSERDQLRKRVMAAIGGYLKKIGRDSNAELIKTIACRSTGYPDFNRIPMERLRNCYYAFLNKQKDVDSAEHVATAMLAAQAQCSNRVQTVLKS